MRTITFKGLKHVGDGSFGSYYKMSRGKGIKVFFTYHLSKAGILESNEYYNAREEFSLLKKAHKLRLSPKPYEIVLVKDNERYCVGIVMQHLNKFRSRRVCYETAESNLIEKLKKGGVYHHDLHDGNIIPVKHGRGIRYYAVDFSPQYVDIDESILKRYRR